MSRTIQAQIARLSVTIAICGSLAATPTAFAQNTMGGFGNFGLGSDSGFGSLGGTGGGQGSAAATGGTGGQSAAGGQGMAMPSLGGGGALGSSFDAGFGATQMASSLATAAALSRVSGAAMGGRGGFGRGGFGGGRGGFGGNNANQNTQNENKVRAVIRVGFPVAQPTSSYTAGRINQRFAGMPLPPSVANVQISMEGRVAVLQGQVDSIEDSKLVERILALEPGIDSVRNELLVAGAVIQSEEVPAPVPQATPSAR